MFKQSLKEITNSVEERGQKFSNLTASKQRPSLFPTSASEKPPMEAWWQKCRCHNHFYIICATTLYNWGPIKNTLCIRSKRKRYKLMPFKINTSTWHCILKKMQLPTLRRWQTLPSCLSRFSLTPLIGPCRARIITPQFKMTSMVIMMMMIKWSFDDYPKMRWSYD